MTERVPLYLCLVEAHFRGALTNQQLNFIFRCIHKDLQITIT